MLADLPVNNFKITLRKTPEIVEATMELSRFVLAVTLAAATLIDDEICQSRTGRRSECAMTMKDERERHGKTTQTMMVTGRTTTVVARHVEANCGRA